jgi:prephenate dehydrogenase
MRAAILGVGLIGGSIGLAVRERLEADAEVVGFDPSADVLAAAERRNAITRAAGSIGEALDGADACFLCAPVDVLPDLVRSALEAAPEDCVVTDVGSTKGTIVASTGDERFVGGHPVAGSEAAGVENARADLFDGAPWYLTPGERSSGVLYERLHRYITGLGARPAAIDADTHDRVLAQVSHLPHVLANVLVSQVGGGLADPGEGLPRVGPSFRDATRVAGANSRIWTGIYTSNADAIADEVEAAAGRLHEVADLLRARDPGAIEQWNEAARDDRRRLLETELEGGLLHELRISVPNEPGIVAQVALALGRAGVNIVDMALAPAPDNRSGAITLWIAGDEAAARAEELIEGLGFPVLEAG